MLPHRKSWLTVALLVLGCLVLPGALVNAGEKKKTTGPKAGRPLLSKTEELKDTDEKDTHNDLKNSPRKVYKIKLTEGKTYQIDLKSKDFDAVLRLENADGKEVALNDDFEPGKSLDSRIIYNAPKTEEYKIIATCLDGKPGQFTLTVIENGAAVAKRVLFRKTEILSSDDPKDTKLKDSYAKAYQVNLKEKVAYRIDLSSTEFDTFLRLENPEGKEVAFNDDIDVAKKILNSRIIYIAPKAGTYRIIVTTFKGGEAGKFLVEMTLADPQEAAEAGLLDRVEHFPESSTAEQRKLIAEFTKDLRAKGDKTTLQDAQIAARLFLGADDSDVAFLRDAAQTFIKIFADHPDRRIAGLPKFLEAQLKKLDMIGKTFEVAGKTVAGKDFDLKNLKGKVVLVDFWATWCPPCVAEMPNMEAAYKKYHGKGFEIIGVSLDKTDDKISAFAEARKIPWPTINVEDSGKLADRYEVNTIPFPVLVDAQGRVVSLRARGPQLERLLEKLLGEKK